MLNGSELSTRQQFCGSPLSAVQWSKRYCAKATPVNEREASKRQRQATQTPTLKRIGRFTLFTSSDILMVVVDSDPGKPPVLPLIFLGSNTYEQFIPDSHAKEGQDEM